MPCCASGSLAFKARDYDLSLEIIDSIDQIFDVDALSMRVKVVHAEDKDSQAPWADRCALAFQLMQEAYAGRRLELAQEMGDLAEKAAKESTDTDSVLIKLVQDTRKRQDKSILAEKAERDLIAQHHASPSDPNVNLTLGKLYCFDRRDWEKGLPMLAKGSDAALRLLAKNDLEGPLDGDGQSKLGDDWWNAAQRMRKQERTAVLARAEYWYRLAEPRLTGLSKVKVQKRLTEIGLTDSTVTNSEGLLDGVSAYGRRAQSLRPIVLARNGGTRQTERAVTVALIWLAKHQNFYGDGSWSLENYMANCKPGDKSCTGPGSVNADAGATAMGLLPFLAAGQTHKSKGPYKEHITKGIDWLLRNQQPDGNLAKGAQQMMYSHGLATIALSEAYGVSGDKKVGQAAQKAVDFILRAQNKSTGGWRYRGDPGEEGDTSVVGWQLMALKSAHMAGLSFGGEAFKQTSKWLDSVAVRDGTEYSYQPGVGPLPTMTSVGLLCRQYLGAKRDEPMLVGGIDYLMKYQPDGSDRNVYYWYYATQVMHNMGDTRWQEWNRKTRELLVTTQCREDNCAEGSWDPTNDASGRFGGRVMQTALSCLTLEIYYRYPPVYESGVGAENPRETSCRRRTPLPTVVRRSSRFDPVGGLMVPHPVAGSLESFGPSAPPRTTLPASGHRFHAGRISTGGPRPLFRRERGGENPCGTGIIRETPHDSRC